MAKTNYKELKDVENIQVNKDNVVLIKFNHGESLQNAPVQKEVQFEKDQISQTEAASLFKVTVQTIINWSNKGIITKYKLGNRVFYMRSELIEAARTNTNMLKV